MKVLIPNALLSYTHSSQVEASGSTLDDVLVDLDRQYPGIRFRMIDEQNRVREHIRLAINTDMTGDLLHVIRAGDVVHLLCALSGG